MSNASLVKSFNTSVSFLYNYFDDLNKIIFRSVLAEFLNFSTKSFFSCKIYCVCVCVCVCVYVCVRVRV